jgi:hypothetical protein
MLLNPQHRVLLAAMRARKLDLHRPTPQQDAADACTVYICRATSPGNGSAVHWAGRVARRDQRPLPAPIAHTAGRGGCLAPARDSRGFVPPGGRKPEEGRGHSGAQRLGEKKYRPAPFGLLPPGRRAHIQGRGLTAGSGDGTMLVRSDPGPAPATGHHPPSPASPPSRSPRTRTTGHESRRIRRLRPDHHVPPPHRPRPVEPRPVRPVARALSRLRLAGLDRPGGVR